MLRRRLALTVGALTLAALPAFVMANNATAGKANDPGRSAVGLARRPDGSVVMVTAWCLGQRDENIRIAAYNSRETDEPLYAVQGHSTDPVTVHSVGAQALAPPGLPPDAPLVAYNSGERRSWLLKRAYPSTAAVFRMDLLPVSTAPLPTTLVAGNQQQVSLDELIEGKCEQIAPEAAAVSGD